jgi:Zn-dependent protease/CBS domain-containing protein
MDSGIKLGRIWNVPINLHFSWFPIAALITWSLASGYFPSAYPQIGTLGHWLLGALTAVLFAASVLLHELGHVFVALREKIPVRGVTLFLFGGVAQITEEPKSAGAEFRIAIAGPLISLVLAAFFGVLFLLDRAVPFLAAPSEYLMRINFILALFNMIPGFPLDGGRVLRAIIWKVTGSQLKSTKVASVSGQLVAFGFIGFGILTILTGSFFNGIWLTFIGWFLQNAAAGAYQQTAIENSLRGVTVEQVMRREFDEVPTLMPIDRLVNERMLHTNNDRRAFIVSDGGDAQGLITINNIAEVPQRQWPFTTARQVMVPVDRLKGISPYTELMSAIREMERNRQAYAPVLIDRRLVGLLSREDVMRYLRMRAVLKI